jgi:hypothetical protein
MLDSRLPLTIRPLPNGFAIVFADGSQHLLVQGQDPFSGHPAEAGSGGRLAPDEALDLAKEVARALIDAWAGTLRSAA